jgi:hypothetical protein
LPASSATVSAYLLAMAPDLSRGALGRRRAAIGTTHRQANLPVPSLDRETQKALHTTARKKAATRTTPAPSVAGLRRMASQCPRDLPGLRDRALLLLVAALTRPEQGAGVAGAEEKVPRLFVIGLDAEHVRFTATGMTLQLRTRMDQQDPSRTVMVTRGYTAEGCSVRALEEWLRASDTAFGPVFRKVDRWGNVEHARLGADAWYRIIAQRAVSTRGRKKGN